MKPGVRMAGSDAQEAGYRRWELPAVDVGSPMGGPGARPLTAAELEGVQREARAEGLAQGREEGVRRGYADGLAAAEAQTSPVLAALRETLEALEDPLRVLDDEVERTLVGMALAVARQIIRGELAADPGQVVGLVREALKMLPVSTREVRIHLHPEDAPVVLGALALEPRDGSARILEDPAITRGGCRVETEVSRIDATLESRLEAIATQVLGGDRETDPLPSPPAG